MTAEKHDVHRYHLINLAPKDRPKYLVYACAENNCSHYQPKLEQAIGKSSICWGCGKVFTLIREIVIRKRVRPKCLECRGKIVKDDPLSKALDFALGLKG